jgi:hypothetical protein
MTIRSHLDTAQEQVRKALVLALENKKDYLLTELFDCLSNLKKVSCKVYEKTTINTNQDFWVNDGISITGNPGTISSDTISFGAAQPASSYVFGTSGTDVISFS